MNHFKVFLQEACYDLVFVFVDFVFVKVLEVANEFADFVFVAEVGEDREF